MGIGGCAGLSDNCMHALQLKGGHTQVSEHERVYMRFSAATEDWLKGDMEHIKSVRVKRWSLATR